MHGLLIHFISDIEVRSDPTTKQLYQSDPIRNEYFGSEIRTNPIGSDSVLDRICTPLGDSILFRVYVDCNDG